MATYIDPVYNDAPTAFPTSGKIQLRIKHTTQAAYVAGADSIKITKLPKGACLIPEECAIFSDGASDPSGGAMTLNMKITDGTTTKTVIAAGAVAAVNNRIVAATLDITNLAFFKTSNDDFYVYSEVAGANATAAAYIYFVVAYTMDGGRNEAAT